MGDTSFEDISRIPESDKEIPSSIKLERKDIDHFNDCVVDNDCGVGSQKETTKREVHDHSNNCVDKWVHKELSDCGVGALKKMTPLLKTKPRKVASLSVRSAAR